MLHSLISTLPDSLIALILFLLGAAVGSFMEVVRTRKSWRRSLTGRSQCGACGRQLVWYELVPVLSYLTLRGRCPSCASRIPVFHLCSELLMGSLFAGSFLFAGSLYGTAAGIVSAVFLVPVLLADIEQMEVPEHLSLPFAAAALGIAAVVSFQTMSSMYLLGGLLFPAPFYILWLLSSGRAMGLGDAKIAIPLGLLLPMLMDAVSVFMFTFWIGMLGIICYALYMKLRTGRFGIRRKMHMPLVPAMAAAYFLVLFTGLSFVDILLWV